MAQTLELSCLASLEGHGGVTGDGTIVPGRGMLLAGASRVQQRLEEGSVHPSAFPGISASTRPFGGSTRVWGCLGDTMASGCVQAIRWLPRCTCPRSQR